MRSSRLFAAAVSLAMLAMLTLVGCTDDIMPTEGPAAAPRMQAQRDLVTFPRPLYRLGPEDFVEIVAGDYFTCARKLNGTVYCWGRNDQSQTGRYTTSTQSCGVGVPCINRPTIVMKSLRGSDTLRATTIDAGTDHACALDPKGVAWCWGGGGQGQLGYAAGYTASGTRPLPVAGGLVFSSIGAGTNSTCGTTASGMYCWGSLMQNATQPVLVSGYNGYSMVVVGERHACTMETIDSYRAVDCWGDNPEGQIGIEPAQMPVGPFTVRAQFGTSVGRVSTQRNVTCVDQMDGTVQCVGDNGFYQLNRPSSLWYSGTPQTINGGQQLHGVSAGVFHVCALDVGNAAWCWGMGFFGQLGNGQNFTNQTPQMATGGHAFRSIAAGYQHTCGIGTDNHIYCWGYNDFGQLGAGLMNSWLPNPIQAIDP